MTRGYRGRPDTPPAINWPVVVVASTGVLVAGYLTVIRLVGGDALFCTAGGGCEIVQASRYATFLGVPTAAWGVALYATVVALALARLAARRWLAAFLLGVAAVSFSGYLTYLELFVIGALCWYCVASAAIATTVFGLLLGGRPAPRGGSVPGGAGRVAGLASLVAMATVIAALAGFAMTAPSAPAGYQEALARHLKESGAVMYGAFW